MCSINEGSNRLLKACAWSCRRLEISCTEACDMMMGTNLWRSQNMKAETRRGSEWEVVTLDFSRSIAMKLWLLQKHWNGREPEWKEVVEEHYTHIHTTTAGGVASTRLFTKAPNRNWGYTLLAFGSPWLFSWKWENNLMGCYWNTVDGLLSIEVQQLLELPISTLNSETSGLILVSRLIMCVKNSSAIFKAINWRYGKVSST